MPFKFLKYSLVYIVPGVVLLSLYLGGVYNYGAILFVFLIIPLVELLLKPDTSNMDAVEEAMAKEDKTYDFLLYSLMPIQFMVLAYFLYKVSDPSLLLFERIGAITAYGMACGLAINNAHELGHRDTRFEQLLSKLILMSTLYMHFYIEHNRGHHLHAATEEDPATSRYGESLYAFYLRSVVGSFFSAWSLENKRLHKLGKSALSLRNEMIIYMLAQLGLLIAIAMAFSVTVMCSFIIGATIGFLLLETVNYIEHYGLTRAKKGKRYERMLPVHSWNSSHPLGRLILMELSRHSDHHYIANRKYQVLRHFEASPQMPTGYPGMMLLAMVPPLWFKVMHKQIEDFRLTV